MNNYDYCDGITHTIKNGETLYCISRKYKVPLALILRANPYIDVYNLQVGDTVCIPVEKRNPMTGDNTYKTPCGKVYEVVTDDSSMQEMVSEKTEERETMVKETMDSNDGNYMDKNSIINNVEKENKKIENNDKNNMNTGWVRYVAQPGDTLGDIMERCAGTTEEFWKKNTCDRVYVLPGVPYYILEEK